MLNIYLALAYTLGGIRGKLENSSVSVVAKNPRERDNLGFSADRNRPVLTQQRSNSKAVGMTPTSEEKG
jgi:hypothetical protein